MKINNINSLFLKKIQVINPINGFGTIISKDTINGLVIGKTGLEFIYLLVLESNLRYFTYQSMHFSLDSLIDLSTAQKLQHTYLCLSIKLNDIKIW